MVSGLDTFQHMAGMATSENEEIVSRVYLQALQDRQDGRELGAAELMVYHIEMLSQEVNSGASFEQYFRWASVGEISEAASRLESLALAEVADLVRRATAVAFPGGLPASDDEKSERTEWTADQEALLAELADEFTEWNGEIMNALGAFYRASGSHDNLP
jgi:hypothetical protein